VMSVKRTYEKWGKQAEMPMYKLTVGDDDTGIYWCMSSSYITRHKLTPSPSYLNNASYCDTLTYVSTGDCTDAIKELLPWLSSYRLDIGLEEEGWMRELDQRKSHVDISIYSTDVDPTWRLGSVFIMAGIPDGQINLQAFSEIIEKARTAVITQTGNTIVLRDNKTKLSYDLTLKDRDSTALELHFHTFERDQGYSWANGVWNSISIS
jgi:hypothetical protein